MIQYNFTRGSLRYVALLIFSVANPQQIRLSVLLEETFTSSTSKNGTMTQTLGMTTLR